MLLLAVFKYRKKIGVIYTRTPKKRSFQAIFHTTAELSRFSPAETGSEQLLTGAPCTPPRRLKHEKPHPQKGVRFSWTSDKHYLLAFFLS